MGCSDAEARPRWEDVLEVKQTQGREGAAEGMEAEEVANRIATISEGVTFRAQIERLEAIDDEVGLLDWLSGFGMAASGLIGRRKSDMGLLLDQRVISAILEVFERKGYGFGVEAEQGTPRRMILDSLNNLSASKVQLLSLLQPLIHRHRKSRAAVRAVGVAPAMSA